MNFSKQLSYTQPFIHIFTNKVTEKYLLRESLESKARDESLNILNDILASFKGNDVRELAKLTNRNFFGPLQTIVPWASNMYTETLIERATAHFKENFLGFWMLGGASGEEWALCLIQK